MTKKEMIEEMAKEIFNTCAWRFGGPNDYKEIFNDIAEDLIKLNYRKIPEGSVVLTSEQYSNYLISQTNEEWLKNKATELQADNERLYKNLGKFKESIRKETAKEILNELNTLIDNNENFNRGVFGWSSQEIKILFNHIAKQYGVEL